MVLVVTETAFEPNMWLEKPHLHAEQYVLLCIKPTNKKFESFNFGIKLMQIKVFSCKMHQSVAKISVGFRFHKNKKENLLICIVSVVHQSSSLSSH